MKRQDPVYLPRVVSPWSGQSLCQSAWSAMQIVGIDEAGRGPLAGPVVAAAVVLSPHDEIEGLNDSKKLKPLQREQLFPQIQSKALCWAIAEASALEIDRDNILQANYLAIRRALNALGVSFSTTLLPPPLAYPEEPLPQVFASGCLAEEWHLFFDGNQSISGVEETCQDTVVKGDGRVACIAAASVLAKVHRDRLLEKLALDYPDYGFAQHKGYPTAEHLRMLKKWGPCPQHRRSFQPKALHQTDLFET